MANKKKKEPVKKDEYNQKEGGCGGGCVSFFILLFICAGLYSFIEENISEKALLVLKIIGISLFALFAIYIGYKLYKFVYSLFKKFRKLHENQKIINYFDSLIPKAAEIAVNNGYISISMLQENFVIGYARAFHIMKELKECGIIKDNEEANVLITKEDYNNIVFLQNKFENPLNNMSYDKFVELPEYKIIKEYVSKLKIVDVTKFVNELSPFGYYKTINILSVLVADGTLVEYDDGRLLYAEHHSILTFVDNMSGNGIEFERFTAELLSKNGFTNVKQTQSSGDYGIDVLAEKDSVTYAIQCKCYSKPVGNKAVQEAYSGKDFYRCMVAVVFTNNYFTKSAIETAKQNNVILWDRNKLIEFIKPLQNNNYESNEFYKENFSNLLKKWEMT